MESKEAVLIALDEGKRLTNNINGIQYILINGKLHSRHSDRTAWQESGLTFEFPPSWLNLESQEKPWV
jgi:hypothetical protein